MKKLLISLLLFTSSSYAAWQNMGNGIYIETERSNEYEVWIKYEYTRPQEVKGVYGKLATHFISKIQANCSNYKLNTLQQNIYDSNGNILSSNTYPTGFIETVPGSIGDDILNKTCEFKRTSQRGLSKNNIFEKTSSNKICEQIIKDAYYYQTISSICYEKTNVSLDNFAQSYISNDCGELNNGMVTSAELKVSNAIRNKANQKGLGLFCEEERSYYNKVMKKYSSYTRM